MCPEWTPAWCFRRCSCIWRIGDLERIWRGLDLGDLERGHDWATPILPSVDNRLDSPFLFLSFYQWWGMRQETSADSSLFLLKTMAQKYAFKRELERCRESCQVSLKLTLTLALMRSRVGIPQSKSAPFLTTVALGCWRTQAHTGSSLCILSLA